MDIKTATTMAPQTRCETEGAPSAQAIHAKTAVLLINTGSPDKPQADAIREYLAQFLSDRAIVDLPRLIWLPILHGIVLRTRPPKTQGHYQAIWTPEGSPLMVISRKQQSALMAKLKHRGHNVEVFLAMRYGNPSILSALTAIANAQIKRVIVVPLFAQEARVTTGTVIDEVNHLAQSFAPDTFESIEFIRSHVKAPGYIEALAQQVHATWKQATSTGVDPLDADSRVLISFHSTLVKDIETGDPYQHHALQTAHGLADALQLAKASWQVSWQSRFDSRRWLKPATKNVLAAWAREGISTVTLVSPSFAADCLETLYECDIELREEYVTAFKQAHPDAPEPLFFYVPCVNDNPHYIDALAWCVERVLSASNGCVGK